MTSPPDIHTSETTSKKKGLNSRARARDQHADRVRELVFRMASGEEVTSKAYALETGCTIAEAKHAVSKAKSVREFQTDDAAYLEKLKAAGDAAIDSAWGRPDATAKLIEPIAKLRGYIKPAGTTINVLFAGDGKLRPELAEWSRAVLAAGAHAGRHAWLTACQSAGAGNVDPSEVHEEQLGLMLDACRAVVERGGRVDEFPKCGVLLGAGLLGAGSDGEGREGE